MSQKRSLNELCELFDSIAPLHQAEDWDNVGLLVEARPGARVGRLFLTVDLTRPVLQEAIEAKADLLVSYHPPIFGGLKRLTRASVKEEIVLDAIRAGISIYSPHTALDAACGGVNDWLMEGLGIHDAEAITPLPRADGGYDTKLVVFVPQAEAPRLRAALAGIGCGQIGLYEECSFGLEGVGTFRGQAGSSPSVGKKGRLEDVRELRLEMMARSRDLGKIEDLIRAQHSYEEPAFDFYPLRSRLDQERGAGRLGRYAQPVKLSTILRRVKKHLGLKKLRLARALGGEDDPLISTVATCAGAGGSILMKSRADLFLSGEMRHHDVLALTEAGTQVILCEHSNTERGYLARYAELMEARMPGLDIVISAVDRDPLEIV